MMTRTELVRGRSRQFAGRKRGVCAAPASLVARTGTLRRPRFAHKPRGTLENPMRILAFVSLLFTILVGTADAGSMVKELSNAAALGAGEGPKDDQVSFTLHFGGNAEPLVVTGRDYDSFELHEEDGVPRQLELYAGKGEEKHNILINIAGARYYRLNVAKKYGEWHYDFHFHY